MKKDNYEKIAVIVPVYNVKNYLDKCVQSILHQDYPNYEIILVDDGSTDGCSEICDRYANENDNIRVIHKANGGLSDARNAGIDACYEKYVTLVDADDYIDSDLLSILWNGKMRTGADIVCVPLVIEYENGSERKPEVFPEILIDGTEAQAYSLKGKYASGTSACAKLYPTDILKKHKYPLGKLNEEVRTTFFHLGEAEKVLLCPKMGYHYIQRRESIVHSKINSDTTIDAIEACEGFINITESQEVKRGAVWRMYRLASDLANRNGKILSLDIKRIQNKIRPYYRFLVADKEMRRLLKFKFYLLQKNVLTYRFHRWLQALNRNRYSNNNNRMNNKERC